MIHFLSIISPALDADLLPLWIRFYKGMRFDRYMLFVHVTGSSHDTVQKAFDILGAADLPGDVVSVHGPYVNGNLQYDCFSSYIQGSAALSLVQKSAGRRFFNQYSMKVEEYVPEDSMKENNFLYQSPGIDGQDRVVIADADEFFDVDPAFFRGMVNRHPFIEGAMVDRWDATLHPASEIHSPHLTGAMGALETIRLQFPNEGDAYEAARASVGGTGGNWMFRPIRHKYVAFTAEMPVDYNGCHRMFSEWKVAPEDVPKPVRILHFSWRESAIRRMAGKDYIPPWYVSAWLKMFNVPPQHPDYVAHVKRMEERQAAMGWV